METAFRPARPGAAALLAFALLACATGWIFVFADQVRGGNGAGLFPLGPLIAAGLVTASLGRERLREWIRRLGKLGTAPQWYVLSLGAPIGVMIAAVLANAGLGAPLPTGEQLSHWPEALITFFFLLLLIGIGEEAGWMAFAAPLLLERHRFITAWAILGGIRVLWHLPLMLSGDLPPVLGIGGNLAFQFVLLWLFQRSGGIWFLAALWHAMLNTVGGEFLFLMVQGADRERLGVLVAFGYGLLALTLLAVDRRAVASRPAPVVP